MERIFTHFLNDIVNKENIYTTFGKQMTFNLQHFEIPTILKKCEIDKVIGEIIDDLKSNSPQISFKERSLLNRRWRFYGADDSGLNGIDQIKNLCSSLTTKKPDRRLLLVSLDPRITDCATSASSQCLLQFYVDGDRLSCKVYQSSASFSDIIRYDCCRVALLVYIMCHVTGLLPKTLIHSFGSVLIDDNAETENKSCLKVKIQGAHTEFDQLTVANFKLLEQSGHELDSLELSLSPAASNNHEEMQYLNLVHSIINNGTTLIDRTLVGTRSIFGPQMTFSLRNGILPLITTKRVFYRGILEELLWFLKGSTNGNELAAKNVHIWDANGSKEFLTKVGLGHRDVGDLGPVYGFQWRHFGATYKDMHADYSSMGVDQISKVIDAIRSNPGGSDQIVLAWNVQDIPLMALPPCHCLVQFFVSGEELSCKLYQRSGDMGLGVPFNIASYAFLTHMIAHVTGLKPGYFIHTLGDAHVYLNHLEPLKSQLQRAPRAFPTLTFKRRINNIEDFVMEDFLVEGYEPHPKIEMVMAV